MARKMVEVASCDHCQLVKEDVERRRIVMPATNRQLTFDGCQDCRDSVPLSEWEALLPKKPKATRSRVVVSVEDVEKAVKPRRRKMKA